MSREAPSEMVDFIDFAAECQICGEQGDVDQATTMEEAIAKFKSDGWGMAAYKDAPETRTFCCPNCFKFIPTLEIN
ncbi:MAG: hypothetical protein JRC86_03175 [Deltaproteobacteria bacterium]|nr:hypothetical protein [Deltaproteobacteria bacterium]